MPTCKDCIRYEVCNRKWVDDNGVMKMRDSKECYFFKDRSKFVDVSELQQNVIRPLTNRCAVYTKCQTCLACALETRERCEHHKKAEQALKERER